MQYIIYRNVTFKYSTIKNILCELILPTQQKIDNDSPAIVFEYILHVIVNLIDNNLMGNEVGNLD